MVLVKNEDSEVYAVAVPNAPAYKFQLPYYYCCVCTKIVSAEH